MENKDIKPIFYGNHRTRKLLSKNLGKLTITSTSFANSLLENKKKILEIGFGDGRSIIELERENSKYYYCIESYHKGIQNLNNHIEKNRLSNIFVVYGDAVVVVEEEFNDDMLDEIKIFFPDPWPKKKHHKRRILNNYSLKMFLSKIKKNGRFHFATDHIDYAYTVKNLLSNILKKKIEFMNSRGNRPLTDYEFKAYRKKNLVFDIIIEKS